MVQKNSMGEKFLQKIQNAHSIILTTHIVPDADGIGSEIALCLALRSMGKNAFCVNEELLLERYKYLDPMNVVYSYNEFQKLMPNFSADLIIVADTSSMLRIGEKMKTLAMGTKEILYVDHHPCSKDTMNEHCIDTTKAATGELAGDLILGLNIHFTKEMALPLYTAILIDTSSFRYPTVTGNTHRLIGKLMDTGVTPPHAYNMVYGTKKLSYMKMLGEVLSTVQSTPDESIYWLTLTENMLEKFHADPEDTHAFINHLLVLDNIKVACMFRQIGEKVKISFRSTGEIDVGLIAQKLGGGGHDHSAATILEGSMDDIIQKTIKLIAESLSN